MEEIFFVWKQIERGYENEQLDSLIFHKMFYIRKPINKGSPARTIRRYNFSLKKKELPR